MLKVAGRRCVVLGGGGVAARRSRSLLEAGAEVVVIAPAVSNELGALNITHASRAYREGDLSGTMLAVLATDDPAVHDAATAEARRLGVLINRCDAPERGDLSVPAHAHHGPVTIAVDTSGISAAASGAIRRELTEALDPDWPCLLELAAPFRERLQSGETDPNQRQAKLRQLTDARAMNILKTQGVDAARAHLKRIIGEPLAAPGGARPADADRPAGE